MFNLLDDDGSGHIQIEEFIEGCSALNGEATKVDAGATKASSRMDIVNSIKTTTKQQTNHNDQSNGKAQQT